jgi:hypothetical protein
MIVRVVPRLGPKVAFQGWIPVLGPMVGSQVESIGMVFQSKVPGLAPKARSQSRFKSQASQVWVPKMGAKLGCNIGTIWLILGRLARQDWTRFVEVGGGCGRL